MIDTSADTRKKIEIYTDGSCINNPGPGGFGIVMRYGNYRKEFSGGFRLTTNNRMEIYAALFALKLLKEPCDVDLYSDSAYLVDPIKKGWMYSWQKKGWFRSKKKKVENSDLWKELFSLCIVHNVNLYWVKGHEGNKENEICDKLAVKAAKCPNLPLDIGFENRNELSDVNSLLGKD